MGYLLGVLQVIGAGICFGFLGFFGRQAFNSGLTVGELLPMRFTLAAALLWILILIFNPRLVLLKPRQILTSLLLGAFGYTVFSTLYFVSIQGVSVPLAAMLLFTFPIFVNIGAHFILDERLSRLQIFCLLMSSLGLVLLLWGEVSIQKYTAVLCGLGAGLTYAIYVLVSGRLQKNVPPLSSSLYVITSAAVTLWIYHRPSLDHILSFDLHTWGIVAGIAVISTIIPLTLFLAGLQKMKSSKASILVMIEPVTASLVAHFLLQENLGPAQLTGAGLIVCGVVLDAVQKA